MQLGENWWRQIGETPRDVDQIVAVMLDQVEGYSTASWPRRLLRSAWKSGHALVAGDHRLAVDQKRLCLEASGGFDNRREAVGPIMAVARETANPRAVPAHHQPIAVMLDFVNPERATRWSGDLRR
jgi:hypothetical protein